MSGKALAAGISARLVDQEPAASAVPLTYFSNDAYAHDNQARGKGKHHGREVGVKCGADGFASPTGSQPEAG